MIQYAICCDEVDPERAYTSEGANGPDFGVLIGESTTLDDGQHEAIAEVHVNPEWCEGGEECNCCGDHDEFPRFLIGCDKKTKVNLLITVDDGEVVDVTVKPETVEQA